VCRSARGTGARWPPVTIEVRRPRPQLGSAAVSHLQLLDRDGITDDIHLFNEKLRGWEDYYNYHRPHGALDGQTPYERLLAKAGASVSPKS